MPVTIGQQRGNQQVQAQEQEQVQHQVQQPGWVGAQPLGQQGDHLMGLQHDHLEVPAPQPPPRQRTSPANKERFRQTVAPPSLAAGRRAEAKQEPLQGGEGGASIRSRDVKSTKALGGGSAHTVHKIDLKSKREDGASNQGFFKADPEIEKAKVGSAAEIGQTKGDSHMAARAVASTRLDRALGTNVLSDDRFAEARVGESKGIFSKASKESGLISMDAGGQGVMEPVWSSMSQEEIGSKGQRAIANGLTNKTVRERDSGYELDVGFEYNDINYSDANTQRGLADLQLQDFLTGQVDRHSGNMKFLEDGSVVGIDNDMAFGTKDLRDSEEVGFRGIGSMVTEEHEGKSRLALPSQIDARTGDSVVGMSEEQFRATLGGKEDDPSHLSREEIEQAVGRFLELQMHVEQLAKDDALIKEWTPETYEAATAEDAPDSYLKERAGALEDARSDEGLKYSFTADNPTKQDRARASKLGNLM